MWITGIDGPDLVALLLPEGQNEPAAVPLPKSSNIRISMPWASKQKKFGELVWRMCWLDHEKFRNKTWYKYKYSRSKDNPFFGLSHSILSDE